MSKRRPRRDAGSAKSKRPAPDFYIEQIVDLMSRGQWIRGPSAKEFATKHDVPASTVRNWSAMAARLVYGREDDTRDEVRAATLSRLDIISAKSERERRYGEATKALRVMNEITGTLRNTTVNINQVLSTTIKVSALEEHEMLVKELDAFAKRLLELVLGSRDESLRLAVRNEIRQLRGIEMVTVEAEKGGES